MINSDNFILNDIYIGFDDKIYRQVVGILMGTSCVSFIADRIIPLMTAYSYTFVNTHRYPDDKLL